MGWRNRALRPSASNPACGRHWGCRKTPCAWERSSRRTRRSPRSASSLPKTARQWRCPDLAKPSDGRSFHSWLSSLASAFLERIAFDDGDHQGGKTIVVLSERLAYLLDGG